MLHLLTATSFGRHHSRRLSACVAVPPPQQQQQQEPGGIIALHLSCRTRRQGRPNRKGNGEVAALARRAGAACCAAARGASFSSSSSSSDGAGGATPHFLWTKISRPTSGAAFAAAVGGDGAFAGEEYVDCLAPEPLPHRGGSARVPHAWDADVVVANADGKAAAAAGLAIGPYFYRHENEGVAPANDGIGCATRQSVLVRVTPCLFLAATVVGAAESAWLRLRFRDPRSSSRSAPLTRAAWLKLLETVPKGRLLFLISRKIINTDNQSPISTSSF